MTTAVRDLIAGWRTGTERERVLRVVQPGLIGLIDGTLSTLAPIFAAAYLAGSRTALLVGLATFVGGAAHTMPFLISDVNKALAVAYPVVAAELVIIAWVRKRYLGVPLTRSLVQVTLSGILIAAVGALVGHA